MFEEDEKWKWRKTIKNSKCDVLEWGDEDEMERSEVEDDNEEEEQIIARVIIHQVLFNGG